MRRRLGLGLLVAIGAIGVARAAEPVRQEAWKIGTPIVTYWAGPAMTDQAAKQLADGGLNLVWCDTGQLETAGRHGLRGMLQDPLLSPATLEDATKRSMGRRGVGRRAAENALVFGCRPAEESWCGLPIPATSVRRRESFPKKMRYETF